MTTPSGTSIDRLPVYIRRAVQDQSVSSLFEAVFWNPKEKYVWKNTRPKIMKGGLRIYEAHGKI